MFLKRERPETDDFAIKRYLVVKENFLIEISIFEKIMLSVSRHPYKSFLKCLYIFAFQNIQQFLYFPLKNLHFLSGQWSLPHKQTNSQFAK